jgi:flagellar motor protein MotB
MPLQEELDNTTEDQSGSSLVLFLGLYLLVLAFFILLISISTIEKEEPKAEDDIIPQNACGNPEGEDLGSLQFQEQITNIFSTPTQDSKVEVVEPCRLMRVQLAPEIIFETDQSNIRESQKPVLDRIVASLNERPSGFRFDMEFILGSSPEKGKLMPVDQTLEMSRAGVLVREMMSRGAPSDSVSVGIQPGDSKKVNIWFHRRSSDKTRLKFINADTKDGQ